MKTLRIAIIGTAEEVSPLLSSAERVANVECFLFEADSDIDQCDAVAVGSLSATATSAICDVARTGKHMLFDLAALSTTAAADAVIAACRDSGTRLVIGNPLRSLPSIQAVHQSLDAGELGAPGLLRIHRWLVAGTGELTNQLLGQIDLANYLYGSPPSTIYAVGNCNSDLPQYVQVHLGFEGGGMALIDVAASLPEGEGYYSLSLIGSNGAAYADDHHNMQLIFSGGPAIAEATRQESLHWCELLTEFAAAIHESREMLTGYESAFTAIAVNAAVQQALDSGIVMHRKGDNYESA